MGRMTGGLALISCLEKPPPRTETVSLTPQLCTQGLPQPGAACLWLLLLAWGINHDQENLARFGYGRAPVQRPSRRRFPKSRRPFGSNHLARAGSPGNQGEQNRPAPPGTGFQGR